MISWSMGWRGAGRDGMKPRVCEARRREVVEVMPSESRAREISGALVWACWMMSCARDLVKPRMQILDMDESAGAWCSGTARRMSCVRNDVGVERVLIPR